MPFAVHCFWRYVPLWVFVQVEAVTFNASFSGNATLTSAFNISEGAGVAKPTDTGASWRNNTLLPNGTSASPMLEISSTPISSGVRTSSSIDPMLACDDKWSSWYSSSLWTSTVTSEKTYTKVVVQTQTIYESTWTCSSTCGDVCYADATTTSSSIFEITTTSASTDYWYRPFNKTTPSCSIPLSSCSSIHSVWSSSVAEYIKWEGGWWFATPPEWPYSTPGCKWCNDCYITAKGKVQLFYWPVPATATRDMCTDFPSGGRMTDPWNMGNYSTESYTEVTTGQPVVLSGHTFYPGNVYLSIPTAGASDSCTSKRGNTYSNIMLTLASSDVNTNRAGAYGNYPINYADFNTPYPWSAYKGALPACGSGINFQPGPQCTQSTVFDDQFHPVINLPISIMNIDPDWKGCRPIVALVDPPIALQARTSVFSTESTSPPTTGAQPAPTPQNPPTPTSVPRPKQTTKAGNSPTVTKSPVVTIGPSHFPIISNPSGGGGALILDPGTTVQNCGPAATVGGTTVRACDSGITISDADGTRTVSMPSGNGKGNAKENGNTNQRSGVINIGGQNFVVDAGGNLVKSAEVMKMGDPAKTINGMAVSAGANGIEVFDPTTGETKTIPFVQKIGMEMITMGNKVMSIAADGGLVLGPGTTLHAGDAAITVDGEVVTMGKDGGVTLLGPSGKTTVVDTGGITTISDANGARTILDPSGATTVVDSNGKSTIVDSNGATTIMDQGSSKTIIDQNGNTMIVDLKGSTSIVGAAEQTTAAESAVATTSLVTTQGNDGPVASATSTSKKGGAERRRLDKFMVNWLVVLYMGLLVGYWPG